jgi:hypothetical protein
VTGVVPRGSDPRVALASSNSCRKISKEGSGRSSGSREEGRRG